MEETTKSNLKSDLKEINSTIALVAGLVTVLTGILSPIFKLKLFPEPYKLIGNISIIYLGLLIVFVRLLFLANKKVVKRSLLQTDAPLLDYRYSRAYRKYIKIFFFIYILSSSFLIYRSLSISWALKANREKNEYECELERKVTGILINNFATNDGNDEFATTLKFSLYNLGITKTSRLSLSNKHVDVLAGADNNIISDMFNSNCINTGLFVYGYRIENQAFNCYINAKRLTNYEDRNIGIGHDTLISLVSTSLIDLKAQKQADTISIIIMCLLKYQQGLYSDIISEIERIIDTNRNCVNKKFFSFCRLMEGNAYFLRERKDYMKAIECYNAGLAYTPEDSSLLKNKKEIERVYAIHNDNTISNNAVTNTHIEIGINESPATVSQPNDTSNKNKPKAANILYYKKIQTPNGPRWIISSSGQSNNTQYTRCKALKAIYKQKEIEYIIACSREASLGVDPSYDVIYIDNNVLVRKIHVQPNDEETIIRNIEDIFENKMRFLKWTNG